MSGERTRGFRDARPKLRVFQVHSLQFVGRHPPSGITTKSDSKPTDIGRSMTKPQCRAGVYTSDPTSFLGFPTFGRFPLYS